MACSSPAPLCAKTVHLVRHGVTEMNEYLSRNRWDSPFFRRVGAVVVRSVVR